MISLLYDLVSVCVCEIETTEQPWWWKKSLITNKQSKINQIKNGFEIKHTDKKSNQKSNIHMRRIQMVVQMVIVQIYGVLYHK